MADKRLDAFTSLVTVPETTSVYVDRGVAATESERATARAVVEGGASASSAANRVPKADGAGKLSPAWLPDASTTAKGAVELATSAETAAGLAVQANDTRLADARTPTAHVHSGADITSGTVAVARLPAASTSAPGIVELATDGETAGGVAVQGNDGRLSDARAPTAHTHSATDITSGTVATARLGSGTANASKVLRGDQTWSAAPIEDPWSRLRVVDHFEGGSPWTNWVPGGGGSLNPAEAEAGHPGVGSISAAALAGTIEAQYGSDDGSAGLALANNTERFGFVFKVPDLTSVRVELGLADANGFNSILIRYESTTGRFSYRAIANQAETVVTDNTTTATNGWWRFEVVLDHGNGTVNFYANGSSVGSISGGGSVVPLGSESMRPVLRAESLHASQNRSLRIDLFWFTSTAL